MIQIIISEEAVEDIEDACQFYEKQEAGVGDYFAACIRADIDGLRISAGIHRIVYRDYHQLLSRVFPFGIFYTFSASTVTIWAVVDLRRHPEWIRQRLGA